MAEFTIINHREEMAKHFDKALVSLHNNIYELFKTFIYDNLTYIILFNTLL